jgi:hypothetical protein
VEAPNVDSVLTTIVKSIYPRQIIVLRGYYNNNNGDITKIKILLIENKIRSDYLEFLLSTNLN